MHEHRRRGGRRAACHRRKERRDGCTVGPLYGLKIVEFEGIGPGPLAGMMLAQLGADVTAVRRSKPLAVKATLGGNRPDPIDARKHGVPIDLKTPEGVARALDLVDRADALIEGN